MARVCKMSVNTLRKVLNELIALKVLTFKRPRGRAYADHYSVNPMNEWSLWSPVRGYFNSGNPMYDVG